MGRFCFIPTVANPESGYERLARGGAVSSAILQNEMKVDSRLQRCGQMLRCRLRRCQYREMRGKGAVVAGGVAGDVAYDM